MAEQYLHAGQEGESQVVPGLEWARHCGRQDPGGKVSLHLWAGPKKKKVPSQAQGGSHHVGLRPPRLTRALEASAARRGQVRVESPCRWLRSESGETVGAF